MLADWKICDNLPKSRSFGLCHWWIQAEGQLHVFYPLTHEHAVQIKGAVNSLVLKFSENIQMAHQSWQRPRSDAPWKTEINTIGNWS